MENNNLELSATSIVALFKTTKEQRQSFANQIIESVVDNKVSPIELHLQLKCMEEIIDKIKSSKDYKDCILADAQKNGKSFEYQNAKIDIREVGVKYDFSQTNDSVLERLNEITDKLKERQNFLKNLPAKGALLVDEDTGETYTAYPPAKSSTTSVIVTLK